jgi:MFS family permease
MIKIQLKFLLTAFLVMQIGFYAFSPLYALYARNLGVSPRDIGLLWGAYSLASALLILLLGRFQNKRPKEKFIKAGLCMFVVSDLTILGIHTLDGLIVFLALGAIGSGLFFPAQKTLFAKTQNRGRESEEWAWLDSGNMFAAAIGSGIGGIILGLYGFRALFVAMTLFQLTAALIAFIGLNTNAKRK